MTAGFLGTSFTIRLTKSLLLNLRNTLIHHNHSHSTLLSMRGPIPINKGTYCGCHDDIRAPMTPQGETDLAPLAMTLDSASPFSPALLPPSHHLTPALSPGRLFIFPTIWLCFLQILDLEHGRRRTAYLCSGSQAKHLVILIHITQRYITLKRRFVALNHFIYFVVCVSWCLSEYFIPASTFSFIRFIKNFLSLGTHVKNKTLDVIINDTVCNTSIQQITGRTNEPLHPCRARHQTQPSSRLQPLRKNLFNITLYVSLTLPKTSNLYFEFWY